MTTRTSTVRTPVGRLRLAVIDAGDGERLVALAFEDHFERIAGPVRRRHPGEWRDEETAATDAVRRYVDGDLAALDDLAVDVEGSVFRRHVWEALRGIPAGTTCSYGELAARVGSPGAVRAVGSANGANPVWIVVPCHRVIRSDGSLGGYGGGLDRKAWLLAHEGVNGHTG